MKTTITEYKKAVCSRCGGRGFLPQFQHRNGGECFACGATGDWLADLFMTPDEQAEYDAALIGARKLLAEL